jgi:hypothetical protein
MNVPGDALAKDFVAHLPAQLAVGDRVRNVRGSDQ